jgi:hypothetical protein
MFDRYENGFTDTYSGICYLAGALLAILTQVGLFVLAVWVIGTVQKVFTRKKVNGSDTPAMSYFMPKEPRTELNLGDFWINPEKNNEMRQWDGRDWSDPIKPKEVK